MSVSFVASLRTSRPLERGVSYHGADFASVESAAKKWLESFGERGDTFEIIENVPTRRALIECDKPPAPKPQRAYKGHAFKPGSGVRCDVCGSAEEAHV